MAGGYPPDPEITGSPAVWRVRLYFKHDGVTPLEIGGVHNDVVVFNHACTSEFEARMRVAAHGGEALCIDPNGWFIHAEDLVT